MEYKKLIKELIDEIQDQKFLRKIYTISSDTLEGAGVNPAPLYSV